VDLSESGMGATLAKRIEFEEDARHQGNYQQRGQHEAAVPNGGVQRTPTMAGISKARPL